MNTPIPATHIINFDTLFPLPRCDRYHSAAKEANENVSEEGEGTEEAREVVMSEKEVNTPYSSGEVIMESFGIPEEEVNMNTPVTA